MAFVNSSNCQLRKYLKSSISCLSIPIKMKSASGWNGFTLRICQSLKNCKVRDCLYLSSKSVQMIYQKIGHSIFKRISFTAAKHCQNIFLLLLCSTESLKKIITKIALKKNKQRIFWWFRCHEYIIEWTLPSDLTLAQKQEKVLGLLYWSVWIVYL